MKPQSPFKCWITIQPCNILKSYNLKIINNHDTKIHKILCIILLFLAIESLNRSIANLSAPYMSLILINQVKGINQNTEKTVSGHYKWNQIGHLYQSHQRSFLLWDDQSVFFNMKWGMLMIMHCQTPGDTEVILIYKYKGYYWDIALLFFLSHPMQSYPRPQFLNGLSPISRFIISSVVIETKF